MQPSTGSDIKHYEKTYEQCKRDIAEQDLAYMKLGVRWHRVRAEYREQLGPTGNGRFNKAFEHDEDEGSPSIIRQIRMLDTVMRSFRELLLRGEDDRALATVSNDASCRVEALCMDIIHLHGNQKPLRDLLLLRGEDNVFVPGKGTACYTHMEEQQRYSFLEWATELREMRAAEKLGLSDGFRYVIQHVLGGEDRMIVELPDDFYLEEQGHVVV